jgi:prepilin-type N-terminal cleavage/methylation domain-containing protein
LSRTNEHHSKHDAQAFTLIEVLIAIMILALGLLGLGAVFPVVITQQRNANAVVEGESVASMAESIVRSSPEVIDFSEWFNPVSPNKFGYNGTSPTDPITYEWVVGPLPPYDSYPNQPGFEGGFMGSETGNWFIDIENIPNMSDPNEFNQVLTIADRVFPQPFSGQDPKYVWDIVARRQPGSNRPQLAIFIRLIDQRIKVPSDGTLSDVLVTGYQVDDPVLPVALDLNTGYPAVDTGRAADSNIVYAAPQSLQVQVAKDHLDWLIIEDANNVFIDKSIAFATQPGQKLLDNTGTVRTVLGPARGQDAQVSNARVIRVEPPFLPSQAVDVISAYGATNNDPGNGPEFDDERATWVRQIVFTPRTPLAIRLVTLEEVSP